MRKRIKHPTDAQIHAWIERALRRSFAYYSEEFYVTKESAKSVWFELCKNGKSRKRVYYICAVCKKGKPNKEIAVDHIIPVVDPEIGFINWEVYIQRLWCARSNLQVCCRTCHKAKSKLENERRREVKCLKNSTEQDGNQEKSKRKSLKSSKKSGKTIKSSS